MKLTVTKNNVFQRKTNKLKGGETTIFLKIHFNSYLFKNYSNNRFGLKRATCTGLFIKKPDLCDICPNFCFYLGLYYTWIYRDGQM